MKKTALILFFLSAVMLFAATDSEYLAYGKKLYSSGKYKDAITYLDAAIKLNPRNYDAHTIKAYSLLQLKDTAAAAAEMQKSLAIKENPALRKYMEKIAPGKGAAKEASYYDGSYSRSAALGGPMLVLRDSSSPFDIYGEAAMSAGLAKREKNSLITVGLGYAGQTSVSTFASPFSGSSSTDINEMYISGDPGHGLDALSLWLSDSDAVAAKLFIGKYEVKMLTAITGMSFLDMNVSLPATIMLMDALYSRVITPELSAGLTAGYVGFHADVTEENYNLNPQGNLSKIDFELSGCYAPKLSGMELAIALGIGNIMNDLSSGVFMVQAPITISKPGDMSMLTQFQGEQIFTNLVTKWDTVTYTDYTGAKVNLGSSLKTGGLELFLKMGLTAGLGATTTGTTTVTTIATGSSTKTNLDKFASVKNGSRLDGMLKVRYDLGLADAAIMARYISLGMDEYSSAADTTAETSADSYIALRGGAALKLGIVTIPLEVAYEGGTTSDKVTTSEAIQNTSLISFLLGCEFMATKELALRLGVNYGAYSRTAKSISPGGTTVSDPPGTTNNPSQSGLGISAGAGYKIGLMQYDLRLKYTSFGITPMSTSLSSYVSNAVDFGLSAGIEF